MKPIANIIISHLAFLAFFGGIAFAFAQEQTQEAPDLTLPPTDERMQERANQNEVREEQMQERESERAERVIEREAAMDERRAALNERAQERIVNLSANMSNRIDAVIARLQNIADRIESRITKLEGGGVDTEAASNALASAQLSIDAARASIANIDTEVVTAVESANIRLSWQTVRGSYTITRDHLKTAHAEIKAAIESLKTPRGATQEPETTPTNPEEESVVAN